MATVLDLLMGQFSGGTREEMQRKRIGEVKYYTVNGEAVRESPDKTVTYGRFDEHGQFVPFRNNAERQRYKRQQKTNTSEFSGRIVRQGVVVEV